MANQTVPERNRAASQKRWLAAFTTTGNQTEACRLTGVGRTTVHDWLNGDVEGFKASHAQAMEAFTDGLERTMWNRLAKPEGNRGSDILLMFALKARRPDVYRELALVMDDKALDAMSEVKAMLSKLRKEQQAEQRDKPAVSVQEQADAVVRQKVKGK